MVNLLPLPALLLIVIRPPSSSTRSRILDSPNPEVSLNPAGSNPYPWSRTDRRREDKVQGQEQMERLMRGLKEKLRVVIGPSARYAGELRYDYSGVT
jgi:hypothetical protein